MGMLPLASPAAGLAQLVRAQHSHCWGLGFESLALHHFFKHLQNLSRHTHLLKHSPRELKREFYARVLKQKSPSERRQGFLSRGLA
jgi:hypothetical protein